MRAAQTLQKCASEVSGIVVTPVANDESAAMNVQDYRCACAHYRS
jgi:hypothetical protein